MADRVLLVVRVVRILVQVLVLFLVVLVWTLLGLHNLMMSNTSLPDVARWMTLQYLPNVAARILD